MESEVYVLRIDASLLFVDQITREHLSIDWQIMHVGRVRGRAAQTRRVPVSPRYRHRMQRRCSPLAHGGDKAAWRVAAATELGDNEKELAPA
jgi:hypothetical protein